MRHAVWTSWTMRTHIRTVHEKRRDHECETCGKQFGRADALRSHVFHVHKNPLPHEVRSRGADSELNMPFTAADAQNAEKISRNMPRKDEHPALLSSEPTAPKIYGADESPRQKEESQEAIPSREHDWLDMGSLRSCSSDEAFEGTMFGENILAMETKNNLGNKKRDLRREESHWCHLF
mmetsp:Transcript_12071/g.30450  ORF Transcript_12071/g.30450 Transcript_12071/m.30450 type:complete len:179 (-) Transcript_12071:849-1385(-)